MQKFKQTKKSFFQTIIFHFRYNHVMFKVIVSLLFFIYALFINGCGTKAKTLKDINTSANIKPIKKLPKICFKPNALPLEKIMQDKKIKKGAQIYIRVFKLEKELELWAKKELTYVLLKTYPICRYSGKLGPKQRSGDKQAPEGIYVLTKKSLHPNSRYHLALNIQYPNRYDRRHKRTGSNIMIHGRCSSTGCFAMGDSQIEEIYKIVKETFDKGKKFIYVAIYPFRLNKKNLTLYKNTYWYDFWLNLKTGYDMFEETRVPPFVGIKNKRYVFQKRGLSPYQ